MRIITNEGKISFVDSNNASVEFCIDHSGWYISDEVIFDIGLDGSKYESSDFDSYWFDTKYRRLEQTNEFPGKQVAIYRLINSNEDSKYLHFFNYQDGPIIIEDI